MGAEQDPAATAARVAILLAVMFAFPLAFTALRDSTICTLSLSARRRIFCVVTLSLLGCVTTLGCVLSDLGFVNSFIGGMCASPITLVFPGLLCCFATRHA